ncbi:hypothetical protein [Marinobacter salarius]|uniref:Uncharacterized protein n=1 Tax=Marinobacter salarius TaxID=1420917 RepID=A0A1W6KG10_9GAMM|nr:hypothetical protein [Marinobacter salarius]ARM86262.1 hypothetical protein MARSALSMR5_04245 [Marinobacter salarius]
MSKSKFTFYPINDPKNEIKASSMIGAIEEASIAEFVPTPNGCVRIAELCNNHFKIIVSPSELRELGRELIELADQAERQRDF